MVGEPARPTWHVREPADGFGAPWPLLYELCELLPAGSWSLVGGLMVQLHAYHAGLQPPRATTDVDLLIHVEIDMTWSKAKSLLVPVGFELRRPLSRYGTKDRLESAENIA